MSKFDILTKYITLIRSDDNGEWVIDRRNDGSLESPRQIPFVNYSEWVQNFIKDAYKFKDSNIDFELHNYREILDDNNIKWDLESMKNADISNLNSQCILALIMGAVRAERFCDGALLDFFESGCILKWIERLCIRK